MAKTGYGSVVALREMSPIRNTAFEETMADYEGVIVSEARKFCSSYGGDFETVLSDVRYHFLAAFESHERRRPNMPFIQWAYSMIRSRLVNDKRKGAVRNAICAMEAFDPAERPIAAPHLAKTEDLIERGSEDAALVMKLVFETPEELKEKIGDKKGCSIRAVVRSYLKTNMGWCNERIAETFEELRRI